MSCRRVCSVCNRPLNQPMQALDTVQAVGYGGSTTGSAHHDNSYMNVSVSWQLRRLLVAVHRASVQHSRAKHTLGPCSSRQRRLHSSRKST